MKKKKARFLQIYNSFSEIEKKEFGEFTSISLFSKCRSYEKFLDEIKNNNGSEKLTFADSAKDRTLSNRLSELTILAEKFLVVKNLNENKFSHEQLLLNELKVRNIKPFFEQRLQSLIKTTTSKSLSLGKINELFEINNIYLKNLKSIRMDKKTIETFRYSFDYRFIQFIIEMLDYTIQEFHFKNNSLTYSQTHRKEIFEMVDFNFILSYVKKHIPEYFHLVSFYYYVYKAFLNMEDTYHYYVARKILTNDFKNVSKEFRSVLYGYLIEYNIVKINNNKEASSKEMFYLINERLKDGMLEEEISRDLHNASFMLYIMNALALKKFKWVENFINKYGKLLPESNRENGIFMGMAFLEYYKNNFEACKEYADKVKKINYYYYINASKLNLQACFELRKYDECYTVVKRLQEYIRTQKDTGPQIIKYTQEFCSSYVLLLKLQDNPTNKNLMKLEYDLNKGNIGGRKWIERKMKEIRI